MKKEIIDESYDYENSCLKNNLGIKNSEILKQAESDFVVVRIAEMLKTDYFEPSIKYFKDLHKYLFSDVYPFAGTFRRVQIYKEERILARLSVEYALPENIENNLLKTFGKIKNTDFITLTTEEQIDFISDIIVNIWSTHAFREGNTRTVLVYLRQMLKSYGITFNANLFKNSNTFSYTRDALVAASFEASDLGVKKNKQYINRIISDIINNNLEKKRGM